MKKELKQILTNYKTSTPAFLIVVAMILNWFNLIDKEQLEISVYVLSAAGLMGSRDIKKRKEESEQ